MKGTGVLRLRSRTLVLIVLNVIPCVVCLLICLLTNQNLYPYQSLSFGRVNNNMPLPHWISRDSAVSIATGYGTGRPRSRSSSPDKVKNFLFSTSVRPALGSNQPRTQWVPGALSLGVKRSVREADHSPPASAEVKKMLIYISTPPFPLWHSA
jgi:hypothetical protein